MSVCDIFLDNKKREQNNVGENKKDDTERKQNETEKEHDKSDNDPNSLDQRSDNGDDDDKEDEDNDLNKKEKKGIIYFSHIPPGINVRKMREIFSLFGEVGRIYLEKDNITKNMGKKRKYNTYIEGWLEYKKKVVAKKVAKMLNGQQVGGKRKNPYYDSIWSIKYLHR